jgi:Xaa-Pro aminopeptidase
MLNPRSLGKLLLVASFPAVFLSINVLSAPDAELAQDLKARRSRLMAELGQDALLILRSAPSRNFSRDVDYEYRQDSNFYYLTGIDQPDASLVLMPGNASRKEILFVAPSDPVKEAWEGHILTHGEAREMSGIDTVQPNSEFEPFVAAMLSGRSYRLDPGWIAGPGSALKEFAAFFAARSKQQARVALVLEPIADLSRAVPSSVEFANRLRERFFGFSIVDATDLIARQRQIKTTYERRLIEQSAQISSAAHLAAMRAARPGAYEFEVEAALEAVFLSHGAAGWSYPSIVASGPNATTLHYTTSRRKMEDGDLLLLDAAANYKYMTVDITRTYPINGRFTPAQKEIYQIVLDAQEAGMKVARVGRTTRDIEEAVTTVIREGLFKLGLVTDREGRQYRSWYNHGSVHFIGMDVHDVGDHGRPLAPGMAFVIEPGIYVRVDAFDHLPNTPQNAALKEKTRPAYEKYKNIGVRIEDSFLLTEQGLQNLSSGVPRTIDDVEKFLATRK